MVDLTCKYDVLVVGGGNAALCAAISARRAGASVLVLEGAPKFYRGGNTRHTRNMRCAHDAATEILTGPYTEEEFWEDLLRVTGGQTDEELARLMIARVQGHPGLDRRTGRALAAVARRHAEPWPDQFVLSRRRPGDAERALSHRRTARRRHSLRRRSARPRQSKTACFSPRPLKQPVDGRADVRASTLVAAAGGFEANIEWLKQYWGEAADNFLIRGTPYNRGSILKMLLGQGRAGSRRSHAMPRGRDRRPRAEIRRRHHHAARLRGVRHRRQQARACASTTRARISGRSATRSGAAWSRPSPTRSPTSSSTQRSRNSFMPSLFPPIEAGYDRGARPASSSSIRRAGEDHRRLQRGGAARHLRPHHPRRLPHRGPDAAEDPLGAARSRRRRSMPTRCGPASPSPISAPA